MWMSYTQIYVRRVWDNLYMKNFGLTTEEFKGVKEIIEMRTIKRRPRADMIQTFKEEINKEREGTKFKPLTFIAVHQKLVKFKNNDDGNARMFAFLQDCLKQKSFGQYFFYKLKI